MAKFHKYDHGRGQRGWIFQCPGCESCHMVLTEGEGCPIWKVSGVEKDKPTVKPSIRACAGERVCHSFVTDGKIQFLSDSTHSLASRTVELPDFDE